MSLIMAQPMTNCIFRTFRVKESFWVKQQSCMTLKVSLQKWCPFFVFVCFSGCHFTQDGFTKKDNVQKIFFEFLHVFLTFLHNICFFQRHVLPLPFLSLNSQCERRMLEKSSLEECILLSLLTMRHGPLFVRVLSLCCM